MQNTDSFTTPTWLSITWTFNGFLTIISFSFGMYVIWFKSPREMTQYKHALSSIVFYTSIFDIVINFVFRPVALFPLWGGFTDSGFVRFLGQALASMNLLDGDATYFVPLIQLLCYEAFVSLVCGFLFRYWFLKRDHWTVQTVFRQYVVSVVIHLSTTVPGPLLCAIARPSRASMVTYIYEKHPEFSALANRTNWVIFNSDIDGGNAWSTAYAYCTVFIGILYIVVGTLTLHLIIRSLIANKDHMSVQTYKLQRSLLVCLCWQAGVPIAMYFIPLITAALVLYFQLEGKTQGWMNIFFAAMGTHSFITVILMTYFTKPYREFTTQLLSRIGLFKKEAKKVEKTAQVCTSHATIKQVLID